MDNKPTRNKSYESSNIDVNDEVQKLFRKGETGINNNLNRLKQKYDDGTYDKIQKQFLERHHLISKKAKKFAKLIREKYGLQQLPFHTLLENSKLFKTKYGLSEEEFAEFQRIYENDLVGMKSSEVIQPSTNLMKVLGSVTIDMSGFNYKLNDIDYKHLQEILKLHASSELLHSQVVMQSLEYTDCDTQAINGTYNFWNGRQIDCVNPVIAALFLPKINVLESHFLHSNLSRIIKARYNNEPIKTRGDFELIDSLVYDPNDIVCDNRSILLDLLDRAKIQNQLWNNVLSLRSGTYYGAQFREFIGAIDMCRMNRQDTPDFIYGRNDGTILKRLLSAFSFRPTVVYTQPIYNMVNMNPYQQNVRPVVSHIPMINFNLSLDNTDTDAPSLANALKQEQGVLQNGLIQMKNTSVIHSRDVLFFYVNRTENTIKFSNLQPFNINKLPISVSGFERIRTDRIEVPDRIEIKDTEFFIKSVVLTEINPSFAEKNIVVGSSAIIVDRNNGMVTPTYYYYHPSKLSLMDSTGTKYELAPIEQILESDGLIGDVVVNYKALAETRGVIFMYTTEQKPVNIDE